MGTQEKQVEKILQKENLQKTTFQNMECGKNIAKGESSEDNIPKPGM